MVSESRNAAILNSGATNTVTGTSWMNTSIGVLEEAEKVRVRFRESKNFYCFKDGNIIPATKTLIFPSSLVIKE